MNYKIINTGSDGNATVLNEIMLIDCGVSFKKLRDYYKNLQVVLLTHIHGDHFNKKTIQKLAFERPTLRFVCGEWLVQELINCGVQLKNISVVEVGVKYDFGLFQIMPVQAYHDVPNIGYRIYWNDKKILYITDTSTLQGIEAKGYDLYLVEANYETDELQQRIKEKRENGEFAYESRVEYTHLSKEECDSFLIENASDYSLFEYMHKHKEKQHESLVME